MRLAASFSSGAASPFLAASAWAEFRVATPAPTSPATTATAHRGTIRRFFMTRSFPNGTTRGNRREILPWGRLPACLKKKAGWKPAPRPSATFREPPQAKCPVRATGQGLRAIGGECSAPDARLATQASDLLATLDVPDTEKVFGRLGLSARGEDQDRKSTRLNSSHLGISYAVF